MEWGGKAILNRDGCKSVAAAQPRGPLKPIVDRSSSIRLRDLSIVEHFLPFPFLPMLSGSDDEDSFKQPHSRRPTRLGTLSNIRHSS